LTVIRLIPKPRAMVVKTLIGFQRMVKKMFLEEAIWIKNVLERLNLLKGQVVLNLGSSGEEYRRLGPTIYRLLYI